MEMLGYHDAAAMLGVPVGTVYAWVARRRIPHVRLGPRLVRFRRAELERWIEARHVPALECAKAEERRAAP
jgi:excisionase family DNA binding protein